ncbi:hypothetical protein [Devosia sp.]|uniref:hypothetical protein n=1 Tax=Devosia sp. TaxID=1871048 RepID=UPI0032652F8E
MRAEQENDQVSGAAALRNGEKVGPKDAPVQVRDAGSKAQATKPKKWDKDDETIDESFPASDPPGNY